VEYNCVTCVLRVNPFGRGLKRYALVQQIDFKCRLLAVDQTVEHEGYTAHCRHCSRQPAACKMNGAAPRRLQC
jgi:hypothetical protein